MLNGSSVCLSLAASPRPGNPLAGRAASLLGAKLADDLANLVGVFGFRREAQVLLKLLDGAGIVFHLDVGRAEIAVRLDDEVAADGERLQQLFFGPRIKTEIDQRLAEVKVRDA